ncbi:MAG: hypothetical protein KC591_12595 [Gemmatimonadetes bacterium]|nr:hypothetical protein [Gemmatimonadota bacterium]
MTVHVFYRDAIHFTPDDPARWDTPTVRAHDDGRVIERTLRLDPPAGRVRILARVTTHPIPKDEQSVHDKWDRAGNVQLVPRDGPPIEIVKFVTAYGGETEHVIDVSQLAPLLRGECKFRGFVDTWVSPAWRMDFSLTFEPVAEESRPDWMEEWADEDPGPPSWVIPLVYEPEFTHEKELAGGLSASVEVPEGTTRVLVQYLVSGHCTDGRDADEFVSKENVLFVDGSEVHRFRPWRADCREFRDVNPYCRRWFDGSWSADFSRSGWCPGDAVRPVVVDVTDTMTPGPHEFRCSVTNIRPKDDSGYGYWRVSAYLVGWSGREDPPGP